MHGFAFLPKIRVWYLYLYEDQLKSSLADQDILMECDQMRFIFNIVPLVVHTLLRPYKVKKNHQQQI